MNAETRLRRRRLEDLRHALTLPQAARRESAWAWLAIEIGLRTEGERLEAVCALLNYPPESDAAGVPLSAARLTARISELIGSESTAPEGAQIRALIGQAVNVTLLESLDTLKALLPLQGEAIALAVRGEIEVCLSLLKTVQAAAMEEAVEVCVRVLRVFRMEAARGQTVLARPTTLLRDAACRALGAISPDSLFLFWYTLGSPDAEARSNLLPALDYLRDPQATPYLLRLLERRGQWADGEMVCWFVIRAFEHLGDRRAAPALRQLAHAGENPLAPDEQESVPPVSAELAREARRVISSIERGRGWRDRRYLLRPADPPTDVLLHPASEPPQPWEGADMVRPTHPDSLDHLRPVTAADAPAELLRPVLTDTNTDASQTLLRPSGEGGKNPKQ